MFCQSSQKDKNPDPNVWPVEFFIDFFDLLGKELTPIINESQRLGQVPKD